jgi:chromate reductase, NAD(P)H dehydrogenase (quinone)
LREVAANMNILAISGSLRAASSNTALLQAAGGLAPKGMRIELFTALGELPHFNPDLDGEGQPPPPPVAHLRARISAADGLIICTPEYAHGVPGALKNALDWLVSHPDFAGKPVVVWNASAAGGERAQASLLETLAVMSARVLVASSLVQPFLRRKLQPGAPIFDEDASRRIAASLAALATAIRGAGT